MKRILFLGIVCLLGLASNLSAGGRVGFDVGISSPGGYYYSSPYWYGPGWYYGSYYSYPNDYYYWYNNYYTDGYYYGGYDYYRWDHPRNYRWRGGRGWRGRH